MGRCYRTLAAAGSIDLVRKSLRASAAKAAAMPCAYALPAWEVVGLLARKEMPHDLHHAGYPQSISTSRSLPLAAQSKSSRRQLQRSVLPGRDPVSLPLPVDS